MDRRDFIKIFSGTWLSGFFSISFLEAMAFAQELSQRTPNLVVFRIHGAMDALQGLNPWVSALPAKSDLFTAYDPLGTGVAGENIVLKNVKGTRICLAPSAHALAPFADRMAVINGIWMGPTDLGHPFAMQYISSGRTQEQAPHLSALVARSRLEKNEFFIINGPVEKMDFRLKMMQTISLKDGLQPLENDVGAFVGAYKSSLDHFSSYSALVDQGERLSRFNEVLGALRAKASQSATGSPATDIRDEDTVVAALASGMASVAQIDMTESEGGIDSHVNYADDHPKNTKLRWDRIALFLKNLEDLKLLDNTLVVVLTEFSRTPALNGNAGKDHNYFDNSALFVGYGVRGGSVVGGHRLFGAGSKRETSQLSGELIDFESGEIYRPQKDIQKSDPDGLPPKVDLIRPSNVMTTAAEILLPGSSSIFGQKVMTIPKILR